MAIAERHAILERVPLLETLQTTMGLRDALNELKSRGINPSSSQLTLKDVKTLMLRRMTTLIESWKSCALSIDHDGPATWERLRSTRGLCLNILEETFQSVVDHVTSGSSSSSSSGGGSSSKSQRLVKLTAFGVQSMSLSCAEGMMNQKSFDVAEVYMEELQDTEDLLIPIHKCARVYFENKYNSVISLQLNDHAQTILNEIVEDTEEFYEESLHDDAEEGEDRRPLVDPEIVRLNFLRGDALSAVSLSSSSSSSSAAMDAYVHADQLARKTKEPETFWGPILRYAMFCSELLESSESKNIAGGREKLVVRIINLSLRSLHLYTQAKVRMVVGASPLTWFPRVLSILRPWVGCDAVIEAFDIGTRNLPPWVLLQWHTQILSLCGAHKYSHITKIIIYWFY